MVQVAAVVEHELHVGLQAEQLLVVTSWKVPKGQNELQVFALRYSPFLQAVHVAEALRHSAQLREQDTQLTPLENVPARQLPMQEVPESRRGGEQLRQLAALPEQVRQPEQGMQLLLVLWYVLLGQASRQVKL